MAISWDLALDHWSIIKDIANEWATRVKEPEIAEDLAHDLIIYLVENLSLDNVDKDTKSYIRGAAWKAAHTMLLSTPRQKQRRTEISLDNLIDEEHVQISDTKDIFKPGFRHTRINPTSDSDPGDENG